MIPIRTQVLSLAALVCGMVMLSFAAVPLYNLFCKITGFGGTPQRIETIATDPVGPPIRVSFNTDTDPKLPWKFSGPAHPIEARAGAATLVAFHAQNEATTPITGVATYNVTPHAMGKYFEKVQCFCFEEQTLLPGIEMNMPVSFVISPTMYTDPETRHIREVTLSYTFFARP
jgi:cytochrome c oxidase assembly protein subunit 11